MEHKRTFKQVLCMLLIICCTVTSFNASMVQTQAATDVTNSVSVKNDIKKIAKFFKTVCGCDLVYKMKIGQTKKYDCSKESVRRYIINGSYASYEGRAYFNNISANTLSKHFFGKSTPNTKLIGSDMGEGEYPEFKIKKISRLPSGKYKVTINIDQFLANTDTRFRTGKLTMILKKKPKSYYGYIVKSLTLKKVGDILS